ncbi:LysR substrate-binding domain-containing protein [Curvibacter sp. HBC61]|uniref:LysR substrate-binding domain-containing protein n=1 Tax=Curvibacter cyanobacteriorum TaxID=3026422 RepID=A0ABT5N102_9BURK|nr:LysR substrate-binding domain-containing protein [Curvibacter sp. HBC61]MDD0839810.1 LysR substrate-binding domain-containing protein [Curvibacter sp. HBC61]
MKLATLNALVAAIEEGSLRGAARRVGVSQPALTKMIRELELELAAPLLMRTSRGVQPTAQGKVLYERSVKANRELRAAVEEINQMDGRLIGELHLGAVPLAVMLLIPETLRTFGRDFPHIRLRVSEELYVAQLHKLRSGEVDVTVGGVPDDLSTGEFFVEPLMNTVMVPTVRRGSPWLKAKCLADLQTARWVYTGANSESGYAKLFFERHQLQPPAIGAVVNSTLALLSLVCSGDYVALMPVQIARLPIVAAFIDVIELAEGGYPLEVGAILRSDSVPSPVLRHLLTHLHRAAHQLSQGRAPDLGLGHNLA